MTNIKKRTCALLLICALALSMTGVIPSLAAEKVVPGSVHVAVTAPYQVYVVDDIELDEEDLKDDFGIGLPTDGSDGYSAIRYVAKAMMRVICGKKGIAGPVTYTAEERATARKEMPKYLQYKDGFLSAASADGVTMNTGTTREGVVDTTGYWGVYCNNKYSDLGLGALDFSKKVCLNNEDEKVYDLDIKWVSAPYDVNGYGCQGLFPFRNYYYFIGDKLYGQDANEITEIQVFKDLYVWDPTAGSEGKGGSVLKSSVAVSGATVTFQTYNDRQTFKTITADESGAFKLPDEVKKPGDYRMQATEDVTVNGVTTSHMARAYSELTVYESAGKPTNVTCKVKGKKKAKKKTITVSWKNAKNYESELDYVQVYICKKKNGTYKKVGKGVVGGKKYSFKKPKGTYYIKLRDIRSLDIGTDMLETIFNYGKYTAPVKVKVK